MTDDAKGKKILGIDFAPFNVPLRRRLQTLSFLLYGYFFLLLPLMLAVGSVFTLFSRYWWILGFYACWFLWDLNTPKRGSRPIEFIRNLAPFHWFKEYFPITLHKTADLDPRRNYLFGYHPHGVLACGAFAHFATSATGFSRLFPKITAHLVTLVGQFQFPLRRELIIWTGAVESSKESIDYLLKYPGGGQAAIIVIGGASEVLNARPGNYHLLLGQRKGFIKMALRRGADLVPVYSFGENDIYQQTEGERYFAFEKFLKKVLGYPIPVIYGRGIFNYTLGFMPYRKPINTVGSY